MGFRIAGTPIGADAPPFIIAEAGINHNGDLKTALAMVEAAEAAGADAIKFQTFKATEFCGDPAQLFKYTSRGSIREEPMVEMFSRMELAESDWARIREHAAKVGMIFFSTPQNYSDLEILMRVGVPAIKVGSDDLTNTPLLKQFASADLPIILSTGMAELGEVDTALRSIGWPAKQDVSVLVCTSSYPTPAEAINIRRVRTLSSAFPGLVVGFSDHSMGDAAAVMAVALGAKVFEKHFTLDHDAEGPDHWFSPDVEELDRWVSSIREAHDMLGDGVVTPSADELEMRTLARRSIVALTEIERGDVFSERNIGIRRPGNGLSPEFMELILGARSKSDIARGNTIGLADLF